MSRSVRFLVVAAGMAVIVAACVPPTPRPNARAMSALAGGNYHTCGVTLRGAAMCWGDNLYGQLGYGDWRGQPTPGVVTGLGSGVTKIAAGFRHSCALTTAGGVKCWGGNPYGAIGDGTALNNRQTPVDVTGLTSGVSAIAAAAYKTCALTKAGGVKCWGLNNGGQLGDGTTTNRNTPVDVVGLTSGVSAIAAGGSHTCAITAPGGVKCWGTGLNGQLGDGTTTNRNTPVDVVGLTSGVSAIAAGDTHTCAVTTEGGVKCWGLNAHGQLGDGTNNNNRNIPVDVVGMTSGIVAVTAGGASTMGGSGQTCALSVGRGLKCWGLNDFGQLGDGTTTNRNTPVDVTGLTSRVAAVAAGSKHTCAATTAVAVKCWGINGSGQLGDGTTTSRNTPVDVMVP